MTVSKSEPMTRTRTRASTKLVVKASLAFVAMYVALMTIVLVWGQGAFERFFDPWTAESAAWALRLLGADGRANGIVVESTVTSFRIVSECTILYPAVILISAVVAAPATWRRKLLASLLLPILAIVNLVRIVSLCYIQHWFPAALETAHYVVWQSLMICFTLLLWLFWLDFSKVFFALLICYLSFNHTKCFNIFSLGYNNVVNTTWIMISDLLFNNIASSHFSSLNKSSGHVVNNNTNLILT